MSSMSSVLAAFISLGVVFTVGLMLLTFLKVDNTQGVALKTQPILTQPIQTQPIQTQPSHADSRKDLTNTSEGFKADGLTGLMDNMQSGDIVLLVFYSHTCPWCRRFKSETIDVLANEDKLPCPVKLIEANEDLKKAANAHSGLRVLAMEIKGLPTSVVLVKRSDGLYYAAIVGYVPVGELENRIKSAVLTAKIIL